MNAWDFILTVCSIVGGLIGGIVLLPKGLYVPAAFIVLVGPLCWFAGRRSATKEIMDMLHPTDRRTANKGGSNG